MHASDPLDDDGVRLEALAGVGGALAEGVADDHGAGVDAGVADVEAAGDLWRRKERRTCNVGQQPSKTLF